MVGKLKYLSLKTEGRGGSIALVPMQRPTGARSGGCVCLLVELDQIDDMLAWTIPCPFNPHSLRSATQHRSRRFCPKNGKSIHHSFHQSPQLVGMGLSRITELMQRATGFGPGTPRNSVLISPPGVALPVQHRCVKNSSAKNQIPSPCNFRYLRNHLPSIVFYGGDCAGLVSWYHCR